LASIEGILSRLPKAEMISKIDLKDAYWQIGLTERAKALTAFTVPGSSLYQFVVIPVGLCNAPLEQIDDREEDVQLDPAGIDYERINHMISESVSQMLNDVHLSHNSNVPPANTAADRPESRSTFSSRSSYVSSRRGTRNISSFSTEKVTTIIQNWHIKFDGSNQGLCTRRFSVRIYQFSASDWY